MSKKKLSIADPNYTALSKNLAVVKQSLVVIDAFCNTIQDQARAHELSVDQRKTDLQAKVDEFLANPDTRPTFTSSIHKKVWTIAFNDQIYRFGPRHDLEQLDDDEPAYFWEYTESTQGGKSMSSTAALISILQHYCNKDKADEEKATV